MICRMCGRSEWLPVFAYNKPDKYEELAGIKEVARSWMRCSGCRFYQTYRNYDISELEKIYIEDYRSKRFRSKTISEAYETVGSIPIGDQENHYRISWFFRTARPGYSCSLLDFGSGLGVFPEKAQANGLEVTCVDVNEDSIYFINNELNIPCYSEIPDKSYDIISCIHTLEHMPNPEDFLIELVSHLNKCGTLFVEVPDAIEFEYLDKTHDEFNSCHIHFYDAPSLQRLVEFCGLRVKDVHRFYRGPRDLSRIMLLAEKGA